VLLPPGCALAPGIGEGLRIRMGERLARPAAAGGPAPLPGFN